MRDAEQQYYTQLGGEYFWFAGKRRLAWSLLDGNLGQPGPLDTQTILDVGCGPGFASSELTRWGRVVGIDASPEALAACRKRTDGELSLIQGSAEALPCRDQTFSLVVALDVFEHLENDLGGLRECHRVLRAGGWLLVSVPAFPWLWGDHDDLYLHKRRYRAAELRGKLASAGFVSVRVTYCKALFAVPLWIYRRAKRLFFTSRRHDFIRPPPWLNRCLTQLIVWEEGWLRRGNLPWGAEILGMAQKPAGS